MPDNTITVAALAGPGPGKKLWKITDTQGNEWQVWPDKAPSFHPGGTFMITYETSLFKSKQYHTIKTGALINGGPSTATSPVTTGPSAAYYQAVSAPLPAAPVENRSRDIFICGALNNMLGNPSINPLILSEDEIRGMVVMLNRIWNTTFGGQKPKLTNDTSPSPPPPRRDDMNDEIPF